MIFLMLIVISDLVLGNRCYCPICENSLRCKTKSLAKALPKVLPLPSGTSDIVSGDVDVELMLIFPFSSVLVLI